MVLRTSISVTFRASIRDVWEFPKIGDPNILGFFGSKEGLADAKPWLQSVIFSVSFQVYWMTMKRARAKAYFATAHEKLRSLGNEYIFTSSHANITTSSTVLYKC